MATLRDESEALAEALEMGLCDVAEVIAWSDAGILREETPPISLCEVSMAQDHFPQDVAAFAAVARDSGSGERNIEHRAIGASQVTIPGVDLRVHSAG